VGDLWREIQLSPNSLLDPFAGVIGVLEQLVAPGAFSFRFVRVGTVPDVLCGIAELMKRYLEFGSRDELAGVDLVEQDVANAVQLTGVVVLALEDADQWHELHPEVLGQSGELGVALQALIAQPGRVLFGKSALRLGLEPGALPLPPDVLPMVGVAKCQCDACESAGDT
jgi:hypothetical protein